MIVVYTVITGAYEWLRSIAFSGICLTDSDLEPSKGWEIQKIKSMDPDPRRASRHPKMMPHKYFPNSKYTIYVDGNVRLLCPPKTVVKDFLRHNNMALFPHPERTCIYQEAEKCLKFKKAGTTRVAEQLKFYRKKGFPQEFGLTACWVIVRRNTPEVQRFGEEWWAIYSKFSQRDQLSFDFIRWQTGMKYYRIPGNLFKNTSKYFERHKHLRRPEK
jgi:hypothetical protein